MDKLSKRIETCGFIMAPFYYEFVKWAEARTEHPNVYGAMRGADILVHTAHKLSKLGITNTAHWKRLYINQSVIKRANAFPEAGELIANYFTQEGITPSTDVTLIDDDICSGRTSAYIRARCNKLQTLAVNKAYDFHPDENEHGFLNNHEWGASLGENEYLRSNLFWPMTQYPPRTIWDFDVENFVTENSIITFVPEINTAQQHNQNHFLKGMDNSLEMCANGNSKNTTIEYLLFVDKNKSSIERTLATCYKGKARHVAETTAQLAECKKEVEKMYG